MSLDLLQCTDGAMDERINLSGNSVSRVWREGDLISKRQPKHLADNEFYALTHFKLAGLVPRVIRRVGDETIQMRFVESEPVTDSPLFLSWYWEILDRFKLAKLRHGDPTEPHVLVCDNRPVIIDWAESRTWDDPRPDKRREGDAYWLRKTMEALCQK